MTYWDNDDHEKVVQLVQDVQARLSSLDSRLSTIEEFIRELAPFLELAKQLTSGTRKDRIKAYINAGREHQRL
jgi:hypothetical protein